MFKKLLSLLFLVPSIALGATWYVRPSTDANGNALSYGAADGTSYANAWAGSAGIVWLSVGSGDTVCLDSNAVFYERIVISNSNVTVSGCDSSGAAAYASIYSSKSINGSASYSAATTWSSSCCAWSLVSGEVYKKNTSAPINLVIEDGTYLIPVAAGADEASTAAALGRGNFSVLTGTPNVLYYRSSDGAAPSAHVLRANDRTLDSVQGLVYCSGKSGVTVKYLDVRYHRTSGFTTAKGAALMLSNCTTVTLDYIKGSYNLAAIGIDGGGPIAIGSNMNLDHNLGTGLAVQGTASTLSGLTITGGRYTNTNKDLIYTISDTSVGYTGDGDGIGIGHDGGTITGVVISGIYACDNGAPDGVVDSGGAGVYVGTSNAMTASVSLYRNHLCRNHGTGFTMGNKWIGGQIIANIVDANSRGGNSGTDLFGAVVQTNSASWAGVGSVVANNVFINAMGSSGGLDIVNATGANTIVLKNNIFYGNTSPDLSFQTAVTTNDNVYEANNIYYRTDGSVSIFSSGHAATCTQITNGTWGSVSSNTGDNDKCADPLFLGGSDAAAYRLTPNSPAIGVGTCYLSTGCVYPDFLNHAQHGKPNIGAYESYVPLNRTTAGTRQAADR